MKRKIIAVTGSIGSGKTEVGNYLKKKGYKVIDCDNVSRTVAELPSVVEEVRQLLGDAVIIHGKLNRRAVRAKIFNDSNLLEEYNFIFFPHIFEYLLKEIEQSNQEAVFVEIPLIDAFHIEWDSVWHIVAEKGTRIKRVAKRDNVTVANATLIDASQSACNCATYTIFNNGTLRQLQLAVDVALAKEKLQ